MIVKYKDLKMKTWHNKTREELTCMTNQEFWEHFDNICKPQIKIITNECFDEKHKEFTVNQVAPIFLIGWVFGLFSFFLIQCLLKCFG
jgi:hypothetical protein